MTFRQALFSGPGPDTFSRALVLAAKGFCMGAADIVPGVSGGTVAFITGIYEDLIAAIRSVNLRAIGALLRFDLAGCIAQVHLRFLVPLLAGLGLALVSMAGVMNMLLKSYPVQIWALFLGLILASILVVSRRVERWTPACWAWLVAGTLFSWFVVGMIPVTTPETWWFILLCGMIAICAMILPGISGAFLLLILGKYEYITGALRNPFDPGNLAVLAIFACGCVIGITSFSRVLHVFFVRWHALAVACLTGFMIGALRKVWPWKEVLETQIIRGKVHVLRDANVLPAFDGDFMFAVLLMATGFALVVLLDRVSERQAR
ncbi:putative membrane protein [Desulfobaculum xiamenense]|uniref:Putative membrane protein n=1 Tax=Desulfobaculum xiamenense TaxID=995050 RepID=A0A846QIM4_9BACT|nr:DUF368 domain-containing protein [Desulfobaculum xiamenense]NJB66907.1 putative membrane protein [Desulfobaculum xiamenense]